MTVDYYHKQGSGELFFSSSSEVVVKGKIKTASHIREACHKILRETYSVNADPESYYYKVLFIKELK